MNDNKLLFVFVIIIYLFFALSLLTKDPVVFPDETELTNTAFRLVKPTSFSHAPYENQLPQVNNIEILIHGPVYFWILAFAYKLFGFSLAVTRLTSIFLGFLVIITAFYLATKIFKDELLALLSIFLLSIDYNFLRTARFGRPEIAVMLFGYLTIILYLKALKSSSNRDYLLVGILASISVFSHFLLGLIIPLTIFFHLITQRQQVSMFKKKILFVFITPLLSFAGWIFYLFLSSQSFHSAELALSRLMPTFYSINSIFRGDLYIKTLFSIYFIGFLLIWLAEKRSKVWRLLVLNASITYALVFYGSLGWYLGLISLPSILILLYSNTKYGLGKVVHVLIAVFILVNFIEQFRLNSYYSTYSYSEYSKHLADKLSYDSNVFLNKVIPDPYFYLVEQRKDLNLLYNNYYYKQNPLKLQEALSKTDHLVSYATDYQLLQLLKEPGNQALTQYASAVNDPVINFLKHSQYSVSAIQGNQFSSSLAIFHLTN